MYKGFLKFEILKKNEEMNLIKALKSEQHEKIAEDFGKSAVVVEDLMPTMQKVDKIKNRFKSKYLK